MRPPRIAILVLFLTFTFFLLGRAVTAAVQSSTAPHDGRGSSSSSQNDKQSSVWGYMYYNTPFSLFPPNAAISLTDDNSTSFAARPAAFGPKLHVRGLSGQLWVGSGFTEETSDIDGELGCSDLPAWETTDSRNMLKNTLRAATAPSVTTSLRTTGHDKRTSGDYLLDRDNRDAIAKSKNDVHHANDGTDDYLHEGFAPRRSDASPSSSHADIQSMQETAEIQGKVVLLMRGGCGFLEKVMWAQRRGAVAVIVGDNQKGGPLIQMFAHGDDVENVTIPSVFTARTTAQLLSSLTQPGSFIEDAMDEHGRHSLKVQQGFKNRKSHKGSMDSRKTATPPSRAKRAAILGEGRAVARETAKQGWLSRLFGVGLNAHEGSAQGSSDSKHSDWVLVDDWDDEKDKTIREGLDGSSTGSETTEDGFVIGVHDWRDPDMMNKPRSDQTKDRVSRDTRSDKAASDVQSLPDGYNPYKALPKSIKKSAMRDGILPESRRSRNVIDQIFGSEDSGRQNAENHGKSHATDDTETNPHEGLWVTITPTSSASPFFDTLLVLVISPLVTLTVVYALLIIRARIRRRRWRAPKSVVERLPVRTYHTVAPSPVASPRQPSPSSTSPTTPLLQQSPPPRRSRPRSRTTTDIPETDSLLNPSSAIPTSRPASRPRASGEHEKGAGGFSAEWRKYMGRQVECVVCLEEYVDGVSQVMSLPCGHEFHVNCITPWLTTRRRTCPICKGDVVRSLRRGSPSRPRHEAYQDDDDDNADESDDETLAEASGARSLSADRESDPEQGILSEPHESRRQDTWFGFWPSSFSSRTRTRSPSRDRNR